MKTKIVIVAIAIIVVALAFLVFRQKTTITQVPTGTAGIAVTSEEASILDDQIQSITEEQLNAISIEDPTFLTDSQDSIASDTSIFYYE